MTDEARYEQSHHDLLVAFLKEQDELFARQPAPPKVDYLLYPPVVITRPEKVSIGAHSRIDSFVKIEGGDGVSIGRYVHIASFAHIGIGGGKTILEDFSAVASGAKIISGSNQVDAMSMSACAPTDLQMVKKSVTRLALYSCILANSTVLPGVTLYEGAVLAAGAVATKDIPSWEIWAGVPAKFLMHRRPK